MEQKEKTIQEITVMYKRPKLNTMHKVLSSKDGYNVMRQIIDEHKIDLKEFMWVILLNRSNHVLAVSKVAEGSTTGTVANPKEIFQLALKTNAVALIICHNHPSGNLNPSKADIELTNSVKAFGVMIDVSLLDHLIITSEGYYSFADEGIL